MRHNPPRSRLYQDMLVRAYRTAQATLDPKAHIADSIEIAQNELNARHEFFVVPDLNKPHHDGADNHDYLTDEERERAFGKSGLLTQDDASWDQFEEILRPSDRQGSVVRVNGALHGSHNNARFSAIHHSTHVNRAGHTEVDYTPRTVSIYDTKEQAILAAKVLRILTKNDTGNNSVASILAEAIDNGSGEPVWAVSDDMTLQTHNALRLYFTNLAKKLSPEERKDRKERSQYQVNRRLPPGVQWNAWEGVPTLMTLHGRPGVKMYEKDANGKDDPQDVKRLDRIREQELPRIVKGVPHDLVIAPDGREYFDSGDMFASVAAILVGPKGYTFLRTGNKKLIGELIKNEADFALKPTEATNAFAFGRDVADAINTGLTVIADKCLTLSIGAATVLAHGGAIAAGASFYHIYKRISDKDPMKNSIRHWVEERCGPLNETKLFKVWQPREEDLAVTLTSKDMDMPDICPTLDHIKTPLGDVNLSEKAQAAFKNQAPSFQERVTNGQKPPQDFGHGFKNFMKSHKRWPKSADIQVENPIPEGFFDHDTFFAARDKLAVAFGSWFKNACRTQDGSSPEKLAAAIRDFSEMLRHTHNLSAETSDALFDITRQAITKGMGAYLEDGIEPQEIKAKPAASVGM